MLNIFVETLLFQKFRVRKKVIEYLLHNKGALIDLYNVTKYFYFK